MPDFNQQVIDEFRAAHGRVGDMFADSRLILLTTTGARTGAPHTTPLGYLPDGDRVIVIGSAGGSPRHPAWFHNLRANPRVTVEDGVFVYEAEATVLTGAERDELFARAVEADPGWADYETRSGRVLPVVALTQTAPAPPRGATAGESLRALHDAFRRELATIRKEMTSAGPTLGAQLRVNCLTVCQGLGFHHRIEDGHMFPALGERYPELAPVLDRLRDEHTAMAALLERLAGLVGVPAADRRTVLPEVERLIDGLEAHLAYEEESLIPLLDLP